MQTASGTVRRAAPSHVLGRQTDSARYGLCKGEAVRSDQQGEASVLGGFHEREV